MPFITEEIWQALPRGLNDPPALMMRAYPKFDKALCFPDDEAEFESIMAVIRAVRSRRAEMNVPNSKKPPLTIVTDKPEVFEAGSAFIGRLAYASDIVITSQPPAETDGLVSVVTNDARVFIPLAELVDLEKERERVEKEIAKARSIIEQTEKKLENEQFTSKAPERVIDAEREKLAKAKALLENLLLNS
jgi:valyl-tRNA synthetase